MVAVPNRKLRARRETTPSRQAPGECMSRRELAEAVNEYLWTTTQRRHELDSHSIARWERGEVLWPSAPYRSALRAVLKVATDAELGFRPTRRGNTVVPSESISRPISTPDYLGKVNLGVGPAEYLARTNIETPTPTRIGWTDVTHVQATTRAVAMAENLFGGGLSCEAATGQLRWAGKLLEARADDDVRRAMFEAVGNLSSVVAYAAFDIMDYDAADRCFNFALWCADQSGSWALRANTLAEMSRKATYLGDLDEGLSLIEFAQVRSDRVSATARAMLWTLRARLLSLTDRQSEALDNIARADASFAERDPSVDPPWLCYYDDAEHQGSTGKALIPIARKNGNLESAVPRLEAAIRLQGPNYPRSRTFSRTRLAALMMAVGEPREAVPIGRQAVMEAAPLRSKRLVRELHGLAQISEQYSRISDVAELRSDIAVLALPGARDN